MDQVLEEQSLMTQLPIKLRIEFAATEGDVDDVVFDPVGSGITAGASAQLIQL